MKRILLLIGVVLSIVFSTPFTMIGAISISAANDVNQYSSVQEDLNLFGVNSEDYILDLESQEQISCLMFAETLAKGEYYYYLYLYDPRGFQTIDAKYYQSVQIGYLTANESELLEQEDKIGTSYYTLNFLSKSENGTVAKFLISYNPSSKKPFRRYQIRQLMTQYNGNRTFVTLGDEYFYQSHDDGSVTYQYKKMNYITLYNLKAYSYVVADGMEWNMSLFPKKYDTSEFWFYGFSQKKYKIEELLEVSMSYELKTVSKGYKAYLTSSYFTDYDYPSDDDTHAGGGGGMSGGRDSGSYGASDYDLITKYLSYENKVITPEDKTIVDHEFWRTHEVSWNTISTKEKLAANAGNESFTNAINTYFKDCDYVIQYHENEFVSTRIENYNNIYTPFYNYLVDNNAKICINGLAEAGRVYYKITNAQLVDAIEVTRLKFNSQGKTYDLSVIVNPIKNSGSFTSQADPNFLDKLIELFLNFVKWIMETFGVAEWIAWIIAIFTILISGSLAISLIVAVLKVGITNVVTILFNGIWAVITFPFNLFGRKKEKEKHYTHNGYYEKRDKS